jgi:hypothetical protein
MDYPDDSFTDCLETNKKRKNPLPVEKVAFAADSICWDFTHWRRMAAGF